MIDKCISRKLALMSFVAAVLVVCIHVPVTREYGFSMWFEDFIGSKTASTAVPFFFAASGYLLANRMNFQGGGYFAQLKRRVATLLIPYLIWCFMLGLQGNVNPFLSNIVNHYPLMRHVDLNPLHIFGLDMLRNPPLPLWFLRALMLYVIMSPVLLWVAKRRCVLIVFIVALVSFNCTKHMYVSAEYSTLFAFTLAPVNILAYIIGLRFGCKPVGISKCVGTFLLCAGLTLFLVLSIFKISQIFVPQAAGSLTSLVAIAFTLAGAWGVCPAVELPKVLRRQSFPIYLCHAIFVPYVLLTAQKFPCVLGWIGFGVNSVILLTASLILSHALHKYFPRFSSVIFGGR